MDKKTIGIYFLVWLFVCCMTISYLIIRDLNQDLDYNKQACSSNIYHMEKASFERSKDLLFVLNPLTAKYPKDKKLEDITQRIYYDCVFYSLRKDMDNDKKQVKK